MNNNKLRTLFWQEVPSFFALPAFVWIMIFFYLPLVAIIGWSTFIYDPQMQSYHFSLANYASLYDASFYLILKRSLIFAFVVTVSCLLLGFPVAYFLARKAKRFKGLFLFFLMLPFGINVLVQAYSWFFILGDSGLLNNLLLSIGLITKPLSMLYTPAAVYIGAIYSYIPFMILPIYTILEKLDERFIEASLDLGANWQQTLRYVIFPLSMPGISTGFFLVFIPVFGELVIPVLLGGGKQMFVGPLISFYFLTTRNFGMGSAFTLASCIVVLAVALLVYWRLNRWRE